MGWLMKRMIKKFIENPDAMMTVNPRFCDHDFINGTCRHCSISKDDWIKESPYNVGSEVYGEKMF